MKESDCLYPKERQKLLRMVRRDQNIRLHGDFSKVETALEMYKIDHLNQVQLIKILKIINEPSVKNIGQKGAEAVWLIVQHSTSNLKLMIDVLDSMKKLGSINPNNTCYKGIAFLTDRINMLQGKKQIFGTQIWVPPSISEPIPFPIKDIENVDKRREKYGLKPLKEVLDNFEK